MATSLFEETEAPQATQALLAHELHAPSLLPYEFANVARTKSRAGAPPDRVAMALHAYAALRIELHPIDPVALHALSLLRGLSAYDAAYLLLALQLRVPLLTFDRRLAEAMAKAQREAR
ncbi:MAG: type II toxin-antitoxin system VapC family toxin [Burkholderiales bacterium]|nr:type II toxin-antitoxin system VapC family toxin [Burkholderiales bacterium]